MVFNKVSFKDAILDNLDFKDVVLGEDVFFENTKLEGYSPEEIKTKSSIITKS